MAYTITYNEELGYLVNKHSGALTFDEIKEMYSHLLPLAAEKKCHLFYSDFRDVSSSKISITEIYSLPKVFSDIAEKNNIDVFQCKNAIAIRENNHLFNFFVTVSNNFAQTKIQLFLHQDEAIKWLLKNSE